MTTIKVRGLHLWEVKFDLTIYWITTRYKSPEGAVKKGHLVAKEEGLQHKFRSVDYRGTIDA